METAQRKLLIIERYFKQHCPWVRSESCPCQGSSSTLPQHQNIQGQIKQQQNCFFLRKAIKVIASTLSPKVWSIPCYFPKWHKIICYTVLTVLYIPIGSLTQYITRSVYFPIPSLSVELCYIFRQAIFLWCKLKKGRGKKEFTHLRDQEVPLTWNRLFPSLTFYNLDGNVPVGNIITHQHGWYEEKCGKKPWIAQMYSGEEKVRWVSVSDIFWPLCITCISPNERLHTVPTYTTFLQTYNISNSKEFHM